MNRLLRFDFGADEIPHDSGFIKLERVYKSPRYMWMNDARNIWFDTKSPSPYRDCMSGESNEFRIGLPAGEYKLQMHFYDPNKQWAPFVVRIADVEPYGNRFSGNVLWEQVVDVKQAEKTVISAQVKHTGSVLALSFPGEYFINGLDIYGAETSDLERIYEEAMPDVLPPRKEVDDNGSEDSCGMLQNICDWLMKSKLPDGFIGDFGTEGRLWYTSSYPIRTLLAGYDFFGNREYLDTVIQLLDLLVSEQMPEGSFTQVYRGIPTEKLSAEELEETRKHNWMNLADVGSMVTALAMACFYVTGERQTRYVNAVRRYLDEWAMRFRQPSGGFTNGWIFFMDEKIYSVSTATTALACAIFYQVTKEEKYLKVAEDAALYLADNWHEDGRILNHVFQKTYPGYDNHQGVNEFGDGFYSLEAIIALLNVSERKEVKEKLFAGLRKYIFGSQGLLAIKGDQPWWDLQNCWHNSKSAGNPILLFDFLRLGDEYGMTEEEREQLIKEFKTCKKFISTPKYARILGVMCDDPDKQCPFVKHSIESWTGCAVAAGGFAGIALAHMTRPGVIFGQSVLPGNDVMENKML